MKRAGFTIFFDWTIVKLLNAIHLSTAFIFPNIFYFSILSVFIANRISDKIITDML